MFLVLSYLSSCFISPRLAEQDLLKELVQSRHKKVYPCHLLLLLTLIWWAPTPLPPPTPCPPLTQATPCWLAPLTPCSPCLPPPPWVTACSPPCWAPRRSWSVNQLVLHLLVCQHWKLWGQKLNIKHWSASIYFPVLVLLPLLIVYQLARHQRNYQYQH